MQIVTYRRAGTAEPRTGVLSKGLVFDLPDTHARALQAGEPVVGVEPNTRMPSSLIELLRLGPAGIDLARALAEWAESRQAAGLPISQVHLCAPLPRPNSIRDFMLVEEHVRNSFGQVPPEWYQLPVHWKGNPDTVIGPEDEVRWPVYTDKLDYELELAAVLGRAAYRITPEEAVSCIAGYTIFNDWSARDIQFREMKVGIGPAFGKDFATSLGPCMVTADAIDIKTARMSARVNGETWSDGTLGSMRFSFPEVISLLSAEQSLYPGDVLGSGTIGRGCGLELNRWIRSGDVVELEVEGIGVLRNRVGAKPAERDSTWWLSGATAGGGGRF